MLNGRYGGCQFANYLQFFEAVKSNLRRVFFHSEPHKSGLLADWRAAVDA
jgi:hypothetical protein